MATRTEKKIEETLEQLAQEFQKDFSFSLLQEAAEKIGATAKMVGPIRKFLWGTDRSLIEVKKGGIRVVIDSNTEHFTSNRADKVYVSIKFFKEDSIDTSLEYDLLETMGYKAIPLKKFLPEPLVVPDGSPGTEKFLESEAREISALINKDKLITKEGDSICFCGQSGQSGRPDEEWGCMLCNSVVTYCGDIYYIELNGEKIYL